ncbi:hypothetical protein AX17_002221 [Amanita inopinata Kibby_2008]|nr:hypothetical protein AX17_002221 [Amanita inopinata Kibby_2008]
MAYAQAINRMSYRDPIHTATLPPMQRRHASKQRFIADLSQCLFEFVIQLLPTPEEMAVKEDVRKLLERLIRTIEPDSRLLSFGSTANGFSLRNSDMDLCCLIDSEERLSATDLVTMLGDLLERETKFHVKPLPHARIPIVKLSLDPSPGLPLGIACDIGFENRLALENTRLLMSYAMIDPTRIRTIVLFLKVWSKRRKINSPYKGTLSSYGYVLLVIYFLVHVKNPPVLPNLQQMPALRPISKEDTHVNGYNTWFFDDIDLLRQHWHSENTETVGELLIDFFRYYARDFLYNTGVASIRAGLLKKDSKGWQNDLSAKRYNDARERNRFCIEDPFETDYNVARCVTKDGLYTIRGEFMRASRILASRPERAVLAIAELCDERKEDELISAPTPRLSNLPPQTPFPVGNQSMRANRAPPPSDRLSPTKQLSQPGDEPPVQQVAERPVPDHMAPKRGRWTSPPPPEASSADHSLFEAQFGKGLELATAPTNAREKEPYNSSSSNSEAYTDEDRSDAAESDDITSVRSFTEGTNFINGPMPVRRPSLHLQDTAMRIPQTAHGASVIPATDLIPARYIPTVSGRSRSTRFSTAEKMLEGGPRFQRDFLPASISTRSEALRRSMSNSSSSRTVQGTAAPWLPSPTSLTPPISSVSPVSIPLPASPEILTPMDPIADTSTTTVYYQTTRSPRPTSVLYPGSSGSPHISPRVQQQQQQHNAFLSQYHQQQQTHQFYLNHVPQDIFPPNMPPVMTSTAGSGGGSVMGFSRGFQQRQVLEASRMSPTGQETPTPTLYPTSSPSPSSHDRQHYSHSHAHTHSTGTVTASTPPPLPVHGTAVTAATRFSVHVRSSSPLTKAVEVCSQSRSSPRMQSSSPLLSSSSSPRIHSPSHALLQVQAMQQHHHHHHLSLKPSLVGESKMGSASGSGSASSSTSPQPPALTISNGSSPALSSTGTEYESSISRSPSPHSPGSSPSTAVPVKRGSRVMMSSKGEGVVRIGGGGEGEEGAMFGSFAALEMGGGDESRALHVQSRSGHHRHHRHHLVTADPAVLEVSLPVGVSSRQPEGRQ